MQEIIHKPLSICQTTSSVAKIKTDIGYELLLASMSVLGKEKKKGNTSLNPNMAAAQTSKESREEVSSST